MDKLNQKQTDAIIAIKNGKNVFLTGPAGSGKSYVINQVRKIYGKRASITSTTGISAIQLSGKTIHSWAGIGLGDKSVNFLVKEIKKTKAMCRWKYSRMLVIDEISMLAPSVFDKLNEIGQILRNNKLPFGGIQLVLCGDFLQLPVIDSADFCFESKYWDSTIDTTIYLDFALCRLENVIKNLNVYPKNMMKNLNITNGIFFSQRVLLELTAVGFTREDAYKIVQTNAMKSWNERSPFYENIINDKKITNKIPVNKLKKLFNFSYHTKKINIIFKRSLKK